jgi:hypothetical protein
MSIPRLMLVSALMHSPSSRIRTPAAYSSPPRRMSAASLVAVSMI